MINKYKLNLFGSVVIFCIFTAVLWQYWFYLELDRISSAYHCKSQLESTKNIAQNNDFVINGMLNVRVFCFHCAFICSRGLYFPNLLAHVVDHLSSFAKANCSSHHLSQESLSMSVVQGCPSPTTCSFLQRSHFCSYLGIVIPNCQCIGRKVIEL